VFDARRLVILRAIAEHRSFTKAAEALVMTQPAVSRQLAALETEIGAQLVTRAPRQVSLTPAGAALVEESATILAAVNSADRRLKGFAAADGGAVRLGTVPSAMAAFVPSALRELRGLRPRVEIEVEEGWSPDLVRLTARGDLDLAIVSGAAAESMRGETLLREPFVALLPASHRLATRRRISMRDLASDRWIVAPEPGGRRAVMTACARAGFAPDVVASATWEAGRELIAIGLGVALTPKLMADQMPDHMGVVARPVADVPERQLRLIRAPRSEPSPVDRDLGGFLRNAAKKRATHGKGTVKTS
jgi:DNA-binding transcriptional LysR family regulator